MWRIHTCMQSTTIVQILVLSYLQTNSKPMFLPFEVAAMVTSIANAVVVRTRPAVDAGTIASPIQP